MDQLCSVAVVILAAGESRRLGQPKQLIPYRGTTLLGHIVSTALASHACQTIVVTGANSSMIRESVASHEITIAENEQWQDGMASSIVCGLDSIKELDPQPDAVLLLTSDQLGVTTKLINEIIDRYEGVADRIVASVYDDTVGIPTLFDRAHYAELETLRGDRGARSIIDTHADQVVTVDFPGGALDIDTAEDLERL